MTVPTVLEFLSPGALSPAAKTGLERLGSLPDDEAYWAMLDTIARRMLPDTLDEVSAGLVSELLKQEARPLIVCADALRELAPLPQTTAAVVEVLARVRGIVSRIGSGSFLGSLQRALQEPQSLKHAGGLYMALFRWPNASSSGHINWSGQDFRGSCCAILESLNRSY